MIQFARSLPDGEYPLFMVFSIKKPAHDKNAFCAFYQPTNGRPKTSRIEGECVTQTFFKVCLGGEIYRVYDRTPHLPTPELFITLKGKCHRVRITF